MKKDKRTIAIFEIQLKKNRLPSGRRTLLPSQVALGETEGGGGLGHLRLEGLQLFGDGRIDGEFGHLQDTAGGDIHGPFLGDEEGRRFVHVGIRESRGKFFTGNRKVRQPRCASGIRWGRSPS